LFGGGKKGEQTPFGQNKEKTAAEKKGKKKFEGGRVNGAKRTKTTVPDGNAEHVGKRGQKKKKGDPPMHRKKPGKGCKNTPRGGGEPDRGGGVAGDARGVHFGGEKGPRHYPSVKEEQSVKKGKSQAERRSPPDLHRKTRGEKLLRALMGKRGKPEDGGLVRKEKKNWRIASALRQNNRPKQKPVKKAKK